jgi:hypothetical protein
MNSLAAAPAQATEAAQTLAAVRGFSYSQVVGATVNPGPAPAAGAVLTQAPEVKPLAAPAAPAVKRVFFVPAGNGSRVSYPAPQPAAEAKDPRRSAQDAGRRRLNSPRMPTDR